MKPRRLATPERHVYGIDIVRFCAAIGVALYHFTWSTPGQAADFAWGWVGVEVFFVISGFVIAGAARNTSPAAFAWNRFLRLYPAAWICGLLGAAVLLALRLAGAPAPQFTTLGLKAFWGSMVLVSNYHLASAYWTLPVEIAFYALVACLMVRPNPTVVATRLLMAISTPYFLVLALDQTGIVAAPWTDLGYGLENVLLVRHAPYFVVGMILYRFVGEARERPGRLDAALFGLAFVLSVAGIVVRARQVAPLYAGPVDGPSLASTASAIFAAAVVVLGFSVAFNDRLSPPAWTGSWVRALGLMTYPIYLLHEIVGKTVMGFAARGGLAFPPRLGLALATVGAVSFAVIHAEAALRQAIRRSAVLARGRLATALAAPSPGSL